MANIERHDIDDLNLNVTLTLPKEDLNAKFKNELNRYTQRASVKGFRKGKTPVSYIKKMYGPEIFSDIVNDMVSTNLSNFLQDGKLDILGQPIPSEDSPKNDFSIGEISDLVFKFDIGVAPQFEIAGLTKDSKFKRYAPSVPDKWIDEALEADRGRLGEPTSIEGGDLKEKDILKLKVKEVGGELEAEFPVLFEDISEDLQAEFATKKVGDTVAFDIYKLEKNADENRVRRYILGVDDGIEFGADFAGTVVDITSVTPATMDEAFFTKAYGEAVTDEAQARVFLNGEFSKYFESDVWGLLVRDLQDHLMEANAIQLPDAFLKRWLTFSNSKNTPELVENDYPRFANNLRWTLMRDQIIEKYDVRINDEDVMEVYKGRARAAYGAQLGEEFVGYFAQHMMNEAQKKQTKDHEEVMESAMFSRVFRVVAEQVDVVDTPLTWDEFNEKREAAIASSKTLREGEGLTLENEDLQEG
jgi:trigger factor